MGETISFHQVFHLTAALHAEAATCIFGVMTVILFPMTLTAALMLVRNAVTSTSFDAFVAASPNDACSTATASAISFERSITSPHSDGATFTVLTTGAGAGAVTVTVTVGVGFGVDVEQPEAKTATDEIARTAMIFFISIAFCESERD